jgi:NADH:ubiquinone oxidoreductase subunit E
VKQEQSNQPKECSCGCSAETVALHAELLAYIDEVKKKPYPDSYLISVLHKAQGLYGFLKRSVMDEIAEAMNIPTAHIWGVATFYHFFKLNPQGRFVISVCLGTACYVKGAQDVLEAIKGELHVELGETTPDGLFTLQETRCLGSCGLAPVLMINDKVYGTLTPQKTLDILKTYRKAGAK